MIPSTMPSHSCQVTIADRNHILFYSNLHQSDILGNVRVDEVHLNGLPAVSLVGSRDSFPIASDSKLRNSCVLRLSTANSC